MRIPAELIRGSRTIVTRTETVSPFGVFVRTDEPVEERSLVRLRLLLPPSDESFDTQGMAVRIIRWDDPERRPPGVAFQLFGLDDVDRERWRRFLAWVAVHHPRASQEPVSLVAPDAPDPVRRAHPRVPFEAEVRFRTVEQLYTLYTEDVSAGGMLLRTELPLELGSTIDVQLVHPDTEEVFALRAAVRRRVLEDDRLRGYGVQFVGLDAARRAALFSWILELDRER